MKALEITRTAVLATLIYMMYMIGSSFLYFELVNFMVMLYGTTLKKREAVYSVLLFCMIVVLTKGFGLWAMMYFVVFISYVLIYNFVSTKTDNTDVYLVVSAILSFLCGSLLQIPYLITGGLTGKALLTYLLLGFKVSIGSLICTVVAVICLYDRLSKLLKKLINNN
ncbi:MAG: hypothetical protein R3Y64_02715 [Peptostreptococcaceae bacterium]